MRRIQLKPGEAFSNEHLQRKSAFNAKAMQVATQIVEDVRQRGDECLRELTEKFDGVRLDDFRVSQEKFDAAVAACDPELAVALGRVVVQEP